MFSRRLLDSPRSESSDQSFGLDNTWRGPGGTVGKCKPSQNIRSWTNRHKTCGQKWPNISQCYVSWPGALWHFSQVATTIRARLLWRIWQWRLGDPWPAHEAEPLFWHWQEFDWGWPTEKSKSEGGSKLIWSWFMIVFCCVSNSLFVRTTRVVDVAFLFYVLIRYAVIALMQPGYSTPGSVI